MWRPVLLAVGPLIGRYCGTKIPPEIQSSTGLLSLTFHTDMAVAKDGFSARYNMTHREVSDSEYSSADFLSLSVPLCFALYPPLFSVILRPISLSLSLSFPLSLTFSVILCPTNPPSLSPSLYVCHTLYL